MVVHVFQVHKENITKYIPYSFTLFPIILSKERLQYTSTLLASFILCVLSYRSNIRTEFPMLNLEEIP